MTEAGDLLMCGRGWNGCLGLGDEEDRATPTLVARAVFDGEAVLMVACGFSLASLTSVVTEGGCVYTTERGEEGQLGHVATPLGEGRTGSWVSPISSWPQKP